MNPFEIPLVVMLVFLAAVLFIVGVIVNLAIVENNAYYYRRWISKTLFILSFVPFLTAIVHFVFWSIEKIADIHNKVWE